MNQFPPCKPLSLSPGPFYLFSKNHGDIFCSSKVHHQCHWHQRKMEKIFNQKSFNNLFFTLLGSIVNLYLLPISTTPAWCQNLLSVSLTPVENLPPVSLILVVHLDFWISPRIFDKIWNDPDVIFRGLGEDDLWKKNLKQKNSWHCPFNQTKIRTVLYLHVHVPHPIQYVSRSHEVRKSYVVKLELRLWQPFNTLIAPCQKEWYIRTVDTCHRHTDRQAMHTISIVIEDEI